MELTEAGVSFLEDLCDKYDRAREKVGQNKNAVGRGEEYRRNALAVNREMGVTAFDDDRPKVVALPQDHAEYGRLYSGDGAFVAKCRYPHIREPRDIDADVSDIQNYQAARAVLEEREHGQDVFPDVPAWDASFRWLIMEQVNPLDWTDSDRRAMRALYREQGWQPIDAEYGRRQPDGRVVAYDIGFMDREEWRVSEEAPFTAAYAYASQR